MAKLGMKRFCVMSLLLSSCAGAVSAGQESGVCGMHEFLLAPDGPAGRCGEFKMFDFFTKADGRDHRMHARDWGRVYACAFAPRRPERRSQSAPQLAGRCPACWISVLLLLVNPASMLFFTPALAGIAVVALSFSFCVVSVLHCWCLFFECVSGVLFFLLRGGAGGREMTPPAAPTLESLFVKNSRESCV